MCPDTDEHSPASVVVPGIFTGACLLISVIAAVIRGNTEFLVYGAVIFDRRPAVQ